MTKPGNVRAGERRYWTDSEIPDGALDRALGSDRSEDPVVVIFRKFLDHKESDFGDGIIALFPGIPENGPGMVQSYMHVGQHGAASLRLISGEPRTTRPAQPDEYAALKRELEAAPYRYKLIVRKRTPH